MHLESLLLTLMMKWQACLYNTLIWFGFSLMKTCHGILQWLLYLKCSKHLQTKRYQLRQRTWFLQKGIESKGSTWSWLQTRTNGRSWYWSDYIIHLILTFHFIFLRDWVSRSRVEPLGVDEVMDKVKQNQPRKASDKKLVEKAYERALLLRCRVTGEANDSDLHSDESSEWLVLHL